MKKAGLIAALGVAVLLLSLGCSDDDNSVTNNLVPGDTSSPDFQFVSGQVGDNLFEGGEQSFEVSFSLLETQFGPIGAAGKEPNWTSALGAGDTVTIDTVSSYQYSNGWHIFVFKARLTDPIAGDTVNLTGTDSVQLIVLGVPVDYLPAEDSLEEVKSRLHADFRFHSGADSARIIGRHRVDFTRLIVETDTLVQVDGTGDEEVTGHVTDSADGLVGCDFTVDEHVELVELVFPADSNACPNSGTLTATATFDLSCSRVGGVGTDSLSIHGTWNVKAVANGDGSITVTYDDGTTFWQETTSDCSE